LGQVEPKKLAQLTGLPSVVKCVEFHKTIPVVAGACSDRVLMWRLDQISREQQDQQVEPSHTVSDFRARSEDVVEKEYEDAKQILEEERRNERVKKENIVTLRSRNWQVIEEIEKLEPTIKDYETFMRSHNMRGEPAKAKQYEDDLKDLKPRLLELQEEIKTIKEQLKILDEQEFDILGKYKIATEKYIELQKIEQGAPDEVSCFSFHTQNSYIAVGVNNDILKKVNRVNMYEFKLEPSSSVQLLYSLYLSSERFIPSEKVLFTSFSSDGQLLSFVTLKQNGITVLQVINFKGPNNMYADIEIGSYEVKKKCSCIAPYRTSGGYGYNGYQSHGATHTHGFIIGCDDGSLMLIDADTFYGTKMHSRKITKVSKSKEWNTREAIECVAVHPSLSLPLFASDSRNAVQLWDVDVIQREPEPLVVQPQITPIRSVGFNQNFLAECGPGNVRIYSCNANDYRGFKEELQKELQSGSEIAKYGTELVLAGRQGECSICGDPMNDPLSQQTLISGPADAQEVYLECGHTFHKDCIEPWINQSKPCPICRGQGQALWIDKGRQELQELQHKQGAQFVANNLLDRSRRYAPRLDFGQGAAAASFAPAHIVEPVAPVASAELTPEQLRAARLAYFSNPKQSSRGGSKRNKYSRKKYSSKKSKIRNYYSSTKKHKNY
jgi:WD40 repeat protein